MTRRDSWIVGGLFAVSALLFAAAYVLSEIEDRIEQQVGT